MEDLNTVELPWFTDLYSLYSSVHFLLHGETYSRRYKNYELFWLYYLPKSSEALDNLIIVREINSRKIGLLKITFNSIKEKNEFKKIYEERLTRQGRLIQPVGLDSFARQAPRIEDILDGDDNLIFIKQLNIKLVIPVIYEDINIVWERFPRHYSEYENYRKQFVIVKRNSKLGLIDASGSILLPTEFDFIDLIHPCFLLCSENQLWGLYNLNDGQISVPIRCQKILPFYPKRQTLLLCKITDKWGVINSHNQEIIPFIYQAIAPLENGLIVVINNKKGFLKFNGQEILSPKYSLIEYLDNNHLIVKNERDDSKRLIFNIEEQSFVEIPDYDFLRAVNNDIMRVRKGDKQALIGVNGAILEDFTDDSMKILHTYWAIIDGKKNMPNV